MPRNKLDVRDFARLQQDICGAAERCPDIESDDEFARSARVTVAGYIHNGSQRKATGVKCFLGTSHTFPLRNGYESKEHPHIVADPIIRARRA